MLNVRERQEYAIKLARQAGELVLQASGQIKKVELKDSYADLVTETDKGVEKFLFEQLKVQYPDDKFIGEESASKAAWTDDPTWIIDPIDGTTNFVHTFPFSCISIGFTVQKQPTLAVVYNPHLDRLFTAIKGQGAQLLEGGKPPVTLQVRPCASLNEALILVELGSQRDTEKKEAVFKNMEAIGWKSHGIRALGSAAMNICAIACGHADAYFEFGLHIWDMAAAILILTEANGYVCDTKGGPLDLQNRRLLAASTEQLAKEISTALPVHLQLERD